jgi:hypothetical protein
MINDLLMLSDDCIKEMQENTNMILTEKDKLKIKFAKSCCICKNDFKDGDKKVRDHEHRTGNFRGVAHNKCNINYFTNRYLPIVFHNNRGYDSHFIIKSFIKIIILFYP